MREIKFRAWDQEAEAYRYEGNVQFDGQVVSGWGKDKYDWVVEQFTGLRDKNGVEIYEGDVIRYYNYRYLITDMYCSGVLRILEDQDKMNEVTPYIVVIGNIHENPELLDSST